VAKQIPQSDTKLAILIQHSTTKMITSIFRCRNGRNNRPFAKIIQTKITKMKTIQDLYTYLLRYRSIDFTGGTLAPDTAIAKCVAFSNMIGNPEKNLNLIHIAGTSGKGSTGWILSNLLHAQGFSVGLCVSPHLVNINERFVINNKTISDAKLLYHFNQIEEQLNQFQANSEYGPLSFFEIITALQFYIFDRENVAYAIMETGMGGRLDATNLPVDFKLCILNQIGLDHTMWLGDTVEKIAFEKAGIIQKNSIAITLSQKQSVNQVFVDYADKIRAELDFVVPEFDFGNVELRQNEKETWTSFGYIDQDLGERQIKLSLMGRYQAGNCSLALRAVEELSEINDWEIDWTRISECLSQIKLKGRFEKIAINKQNVILDGAHNQQKMEAFLDSLFELYSDPEDKFDLVLAFKKDKNIPTMLELIAKYKDKWNQVIITSFDISQDSKILSINPEEIAIELQKLGLKSIVETDLNTILNNISAPTVITGSLYLIGAIHSLI
jgi:dihydrofolate synthase / folylpolyglutamate synthase